MHGMDIPFLFFYQMENAPLEDSWNSLKRRSDRGRMLGVFGH